MKKVRIIVDWGKLVEVSTRSSYIRGLKFRQLLILARFKNTFFNFFKDTKKAYFFFKIDVFQLP
jgi:hypothetical protein